MEDQPKAKIKVSFGMPQHEDAAPEEGPDYYKSKLMEVKGLLESGDSEGALSTINECLSEHKESEEPAREEMGDSPMPSTGGLKIKFK